MIFLFKLLVHMLWKDFSFPKYNSSLKALFDFSELDLVPCTCGRATPARLGDSDPSSARQTSLVSPPSEGEKEWEDFLNGAVQPEHPMGPSALINSYDRTPRRNTC